MLALLLLQLPVWLAFLPPVCTPKPQAIFGRLGEYPLLRARGSGRLRLLSLPEFRGHGPLALVLPLALCLVECDRPQLAT